MFDLAGLELLLADHTLSAVALAIAVGGTALAVVLGGAALLLARERPSPAQIRVLMREANAPLEAMVAELSRSLDASRHDMGWHVGPGRAPAPLDEVLDQTLAAARRLPGAPAAAIVLERDGEEPRVATSGFAPGAPYDPATLRPAGARAVLVSYRHEEGVANGEAIRSGASVPLGDAADRPGGSLAVFWRSAAPEPGDRELEQLEELAARAAPAIERALRSERGEG